MRMEKLIKYARKLKKLLLSCSRSNDQENSASPLCTVYCEELFLKSAGKKGRFRRNENDMDPFILAHIAAQNHFSFRPNIYI
jgi:hypothetical protein